MRLIALVPAVLVQVAKETAAEAVLVPACKPEEGEELTRRVLPAKGTVQVGLEVMEHPTASAEALLLMQLEEVGQVVIVQRPAAPGEVEQEPTIWHQVQRLARRTLEVEAEVVFPHK